MSPLGKPQTRCSPQKRQGQCVQPWSTDASSNRKIQAANAAKSSEQGPSQSSSDDCPNKQKYGSVVRAKTAKPAWGRRSAMQRDSASATKTLQSRSICTSGPWMNLMGVHAGRKKRENREDPKMHTVRVSSEGMCCDLGCIRL